MPSFSNALMPLQQRSQLNAKQLKQQRLQERLQLNWQHKWHQLAYVLLF
jgi:hypothetical protein